MNSPQGPEVGAGVWVGVKDRTDDHVEDQAGDDRVADEAEDASAGCRGAGALHGEGGAQVAGHEQHEHGDARDHAERVLLGKFVGHLEGEMLALGLGGLLVESGHLAGGDQARGLGDHHGVALCHEAAVDLGAVGGVLQGGLVLVVVDLQRDVFLDGCGQRRAAGHAPRKVAGDHGMLGRHVGRDHDGGHHEGHQQAGDQRPPGRRPRPLVRHRGRGVPSARPTRGRLSRTHRARGRGRRRRRTVPDTAVRTPVGVPAGVASCAAHGISLVTGRLGHLVSRTPEHPATLPERTAQNGHFVSVLSILVR